MALFGSGWLEDDRLPQERGKRQENNIYDDYRGYDFSDYFNVDTNSEEYKQMRDKIQQFMLNNMRPKMHWVQKSTPYALAARFYCSNCGNDEMYKTPFCPICGAMEVEDD